MTKKRDDFAVSLMNRFMQIRTRLNEKSYTKIAPIKAEVKGSSRMYTQLKAQNLVISDKKGRLVWNESIPITYILGKSIAKELRRLSTVAKTTPTKVTPVKVTPDIIQHLKVDNSKFNWSKPIILKEKLKPKVEEVDEEVKEDKPSLTVSFAWGLFKYIRG